MFLAMCTKSVCSFAFYCVTCYSHGSMALFLVMCYPFMFISFGTEILISPQNPGMIYNI